MAGYPGIDMIFVMFATYQAVRRGTSALESQIDAILEVSAGSEKPMAVILFTAGLLQGEKVACEVHGRFVQAGLPVFPTFSRAAHAVSRLISYNRKSRDLSRSYCLVRDALTPFSNCLRVSILAGSVNESIMYS
jgi:hypothetical protein